MRIPRLYTTQRLAPGLTVALEERDRHYLTRVLRVRRDEPVVLFNGDGSDYSGSVTEIRRDRLHIGIRARLPAARESPLCISLAQAVSRGERMDSVLQKCTELGVVAFRPLFTERVEVRVSGPRLEKRMAHWTGVIRSACEQCGRAVVPELLEPLSFADWLSAPGVARRFLLDPRAEAALSSQVMTAPEIELLVGPEGGFSDRELTEAGSAGIRALNLGPRVLRTETAAPAAVAILQAMFGDL